MKIFKFLSTALIISGLAMSCEKEEVTVEEDGSTNPPTTKNAMNPTTGLGGSLAQFTIVGDYLYTIDYKTLNIFSLQDPGTPALSDKIDMPIGMETIFHQNGYLYVGANDGVHILDISNPRNPQEVSEFQHVTTCDPVVANNDIAIATLRGGTECGGNFSQMDIIDLSDITQPELIGEYSLDNPYGLGFNQLHPEIVYVCDGYSGLKAYDITDIDNPELVMTMPDIEALDVISTDNDHLIVLARDGVHQFDAKNPIQLVEKSVINL